MTEESVIEFPCDFPIKMMGRDDPGFRDTVTAIVEKHAGPVSEDAIKAAPSSKGNFIAITITIDAESQEQLDNIYQDLTANEDVLFSL